MEIRILLTGGGSGGHIVPLVAVTRKIKDLAASSGKTVTISYFGNPGQYADYLKVSGVDIVPIVSSKLRRYFDIQNFLDIFRFVWSLFQSFWKVFLFMPDVAFSKGGPGSLAILTACRFYRIPIVVHESDAVPGVTNRISAKSARLVEIAFEAARSSFPKRATIELAGLPIRDGLAPTSSVEDARKMFQLQPDLPTILVVGGSQGAEALNNFVIENIGQLLSKFQIIHQVGPKNYERYKNEYTFVSEKLKPELKPRYYFAPYFGADMRDAYQAADIVISRAGASTIFELAFVGKPAILIPISSSPNDHQRQNAYVYEKQGAATIIVEENLLPNLVAITIENILKNPERKAKMNEAARKFFIPNAAEKIAKDILEIAAGK